jgi:hypothetical protein
VRVFAQAARAGKRQLASDVPGSRRGMTLGLVWPAYDWDSNTYEVVKNSLVEEHVPVTGAVFFVCRGAESERPLAGARSCIFPLTKNGYTFVGRELLWVRVRRLRRSSEAS